MKFQGSLIATGLMILMVLSFVVVVQPIDTSGQSQSEPSIQAYPSPSQVNSPERNPIIDEYAKIHAVSYEEAYRRLEIQSQMTKVIDRIAQAEPSYAGSWIQHQPDFRIFIAFASPDAVRILQPHLNDVAWASIVDVQQARLTLSELEQLVSRVNGVASRMQVPFESGISFQKGKVTVYTPDPDAVRNQFLLLDEMKPLIDSIEFVQQKDMTIPAELKYPALVGGNALSLCTTGFTVVRTSDLRRFTATAGHCNDTLDQNSVTIGYNIYENNPVPSPPVGPRGKALDLQVHDPSVRGFHLVNAVRVGPSATTRVVGTWTKSSTLGKWVCKYGKSTQFTCGYVVDLYFAAYGGGVNTYVKVDRATGAPSIGCSGDSGAPLYEFASGGVNGLGILSGVLPGVAGCLTDHASLVYSPVDEINQSGYQIAADTYQQYFYQSVFWSATNCQEYEVPVDDNGYPNWSFAANYPCSTYAPGSGTLQTYTSYVVGNYLHEALWRGNVGYTRDVPLHASGYVNWAAAPAWTQCCTGTPPEAQDAYVVGNNYFQNVFWSATNCIAYTAPLDASGNIIWSSQTSQPCQTYAPGSGTVQTYAAYILGNYLTEAIWRGNIGYTRAVPLDSSGTSVLWGSAPAWQQCTGCSGAAPAAQGAYILVHRP